MITRVSFMGKPHSSTLEAVLPKCILITDILIAYIFQPFPKTYVIIPPFLPLSKTVSLSFFHLVTPCLN